MDRAIKNFSPWQGTFAADAINKKVAMIDQNYQGNSKIIDRLAIYGRVNQ